MIVILCADPLFSCFFSLQLLYHHVRVYLPTSSTHRQNISGGGHASVSPADFRAQAESVLLPMLAQLHTTVQQTTGVLNPSANPSDQLDIYRPQIVAPVYQARLSTANVAASFISAMIGRIQKQVHG